MTKQRYSTLNIRGTIYKTILTTKFKNRKSWQQPNEKEINSYIPGTVIRVYCKAGQKVKMGDDLMIYEAMKMENRVIAPHDGIIKSVNFVEGDKFPKGVILFEYK